MVNNRPYGQISPTAAQLRAARGAVELSVAQLAERAGLGVNTVRRAEAAGAAVLTTANQARLVETLTALGVTFIEATAEGPGVRILSRDDRSAD